MEIKISTKQLDSTYFRVLFELAKQEGIEALQKLLNDLETLQRRPLGEEAILCGTHATLSLTSRNKAVVTYLRDHINELRGINLSDSSIRYTVASLARTPDLLDTYLKNARILEEYRVGNITTFYNDNSLYDLNTPVQIYRNKTGKLTDIIKYYTDGEFKYSLPWTSQRISYSSENIPTELVREVPATWVLRSENHEDGRQYRYMYLSSFDFNADKLPTEEELQSYDLPASLKLYLNK